MKHLKHAVPPKRRGSALVLSIMFLAIFSALAVALATTSGTNVQLAANHHKASLTRAGAESGLEVVRHWMSQVALSGTTAPDQRFTALGMSLQNALADAGADNLQPVCTTSTISIANVSLDASRGLTFSALLTKMDDDNVQLDVTGHCGSFDRTIRTGYVFGPRANPVFNYGVASKGPVSLSGNVNLEGVTHGTESSVYIESENALLALSIMGHSHISGQVKIVNPMADIFLQGGQAGIGGVTGDEATEEPYTTIGVTPAEFPDMVPSEFAGLVTMTEMDPNTNTRADATLENVVIPANLNPTFSGHATLKGLVWIETPNVVTFTGGAAVTAIIVGDGDATDNSATNILDFRGHVEGENIASLPEGETQFDSLRDKTGTFIIAPGFHVSFGGSFDALCGAVAANGIEFYGNAGGTIQGAILNYSDNQMTLSGNSDLYFNHSGVTEAPAGFVPDIILQYDGSSYSEVI